ncbi:Cytochrome P450 [Lachnellula occidentalis]|uniref:Cytochrome P450 n=1 Tax=Lachnellula occidentalis TaxID=215460 RepID=A0A8H8U9H0_9HELO|nr:Cytochrome P450 [Lachnellula occidentalis]
MHWVTALSAAVIALFVAYFLCSSPTLKRNGIPLRPSPGRLPLIGNGLIFLQPRQKLFAWFVKCERQFGFETFQISVPTLPPGVVINDPKNLEYVLKNEGLFPKGDFVKSRSWDLFGNGIINADGELWKVQRKAGVHFLSNANLKVLTEAALPAYLTKTISLLGTSQPEDVVDLSDIFHELTTQLFGRMAYNMEMHHSDAFSAAFDYASGATAERFQNPLWKITEPFFGRKHRKSIAQVKAFGSEIVAQAVKTKQNKKPVSNVNTKSGSANTVEGISGSLIHSLLDTIDDHSVVADAALNYLTAGRDTVAQTLTWLFYCLMGHPDVIKAIRTEVDNVATASSSIEGEFLDPSRVDTALFQPSALPYTMAAFYEALRLYPPIPFEFRQCVEPTTLPDGTFLPKDTVLLWCTWAMNRSRLIWGKDSDKFRPESWFDNGKLVTKTAFEFPVFNGGPRLCLGKKMAESVAVQVIATFVLHFDFEALDNNERFSKDSLTLPMEGGLPCNIKVRNHSPGGKP